jgi:hypothetical protein
MIFNPSFESKAAHSTPPMFWEDCGTDTNSPSDIHDNLSNFFDVRKDAQDGNSYVGMVIRDNVTWEAIGQTLGQPLLSDYQYQFSIHLARSESYQSFSKRTREEIAFTEAAVLRIWGGNSANHRGQLLAESLPVEHTDWEEYTFEFEPTEDWEYFILEAFFEAEDGFVYNGNLLLDNCSEIYVFNNLEFSEIMDYESLTPHNLLNLVIDCKRDDTNLSDTSVLDVVYDSWIFQQTCLDVGMKELVTGLNESSLEHYLDIYRKMGLIKSIEIIEETMFLAEKNSNIWSEVRYLKNCDELFKNSLITEKAYDKRLNFIRENREGITEGLKGCEE